MKLEVARQHASPNQINLSTISSAAPGSLSGQTWWLLALSFVPFAVWRAAHMGAVLRLPLQRPLRRNTAATHYEYDLHDGWWRASNG